MGFWILALLAAAVAVIVIGFALVTKRGAGADATAAYDMRVYRDQLKELDRDVARGVVAAEEADRARVEISRRLLEADRNAQASQAGDAAPVAVTYGTIAALAILLAGGGAWLYSDLGAPGYWDMPMKGRIEAAAEVRASRPTQAEAEAELPAWAGPPPEAPPDYIDLVDQLRAAVAKRPDDMQGQTLLATHETALGNYRAAYAAKARVIELKGDDATADDYASYADLLVLAAQGYVSPEAEQALTNALQIDPRDPVARYYSGLMFAQTGRPDYAFRLWRELLESSAPTDPWVDPIRGQIMQLAAMAGVDYSLPESGRGPSADDIENAADMRPEDQAQMIAGMVNRLMERLATEGGTAGEWAQLIGALGVQGEIGRAREIFTEAQTVFADRPDELAMIAAAAERAGVTGTSAPAPQLAGPTADDVAAAADMSEEDRARMIDNMVTRLADELGTNGGPPEKWIQLLNALAVLGETQRAALTWADAQDAFADDADGLARIKEAAVAAGVAE